jgi:S1-C subfamily serine protease
MVSFAAAALISCLPLANPSFVEEPIVLEARSESPEANVAELKKLEARVSEAIRKALPALVAIDIPRPGTLATPKIDHVAQSRGSGVIISRDGLILSQWHVSHVAREGLFRGPGDEVEIAIQDGRHLKAQLLGADPVRDLSLLRIVKSGDYPHLALAKPNTVVRGDRVLKLGHPFGYRASRGATARLGRVLYLGESIEIVADFLTFAGDSGGPLVNLEG